MDFKQLELFSVLSQELHFARTAKKCFITASAVTRSVQRLEQELGVDLLVRTNRNVELTQAGKVFSDFANDCLQKRFQMKQSLMLQAKVLAGQLRVYSSTTASYGVLSRMLPEFRLAHPQVELQLHTGDQANAINLIITGEEDIAIAAMPDELPEGIAFKTLLFSPLRFIQPSEQGGLLNLIEELRGGGDILDVSRLPLIVSERGLARKRLNHWFKKHKLTPNIYAQVSGHESIVTLVALGFGIGLVPELVIEHSPFRDKIRIMDNVPELQAFQVGLCAMNDKVSQPVIKAFWDTADPMLFKDGVHHE